VGIGSDPRIGYSFLYAGTGYGGSCFPKDIQALTRTARDNGKALRVLEAVEAVNDDQKSVLTNKVLARFGTDLAGRTFALWGLAFKPNTDDMREAPSRVIIEELVRRGATIKAYDPVAMTEAQRVFEGVAGLTFVESQAAALTGSDALVIVTEWRQFKSPDFEQIRSTLKQPVVFDGRNLYDTALMKDLGIEYRGIGRSTDAGAG